MEKTPVDTGRAQCNWHTSINSPERYIKDVDGTSDSPTPPMLMPEMDKIKSAKAEDTIYIQNNLPYIVGLEYGRSIQSPQGMVRLTMQEVSTYIDEAIKGVK